MTQKIQFRRGTSAQWSTANTVLSSGEPGWDTTEEKLKVGNGVDAWDDLDFITGPNNNPPVVVANQAARLALDAIVGDVVKQTDTGVTYALADLPASVNGNWLAIASPSAAENNPPLVVANQAARLAISGAVIGDQVKQTDTDEVYTLGSLPASTNGNWINISDLTPGWASIPDKPDFPDFVSDGDGILFLADDGTYKSVVLNGTAAYATSIPFTLPYTKMATHTVAAPIALTKNTVDAIPGAVTLLKLVADGVNIPDFSDFKAVSTSGDYDNGDGVINVLCFFYDGEDYWITIFHEAVADVTAPTLVSATVEDSNKDKIVLTYDEDLDEASIPDVGDFSPSGGKTVTDVAIVGAVVTLTCDGDYASGDAITIDYTPGTNKIRDLADPPNNAVALSSQAVTNNIVAGEEDLIFGSFTNMTQVGTTLNGGDSGWNSFGLATKKLASGVNGEIRGTPGSTAGAGIFFNTANVAANFSGGEYGVFVVNIVDGSTIFYVDGGSFTDSGLTWANGDRFILRRVSGVVSAYRLRSGVETLARTFPTPYTGDLFINANCNSSTNTIETPTGINVS